MSTAEKKIRMGFIGVAGRGREALMPWFGRHEDVEITAVCDVYEPHIERAVADTDGKAIAYHDYKDLIANPDIDAVAVATPPQWHAIISIEAMLAGKDVYCEKPMCRYPLEGKRMADVAAATGRVTQVGTQIHATENYRRCVDIVRSGALGRIVAARVFCTMNDDSEGLGLPADSAPPEGLDWEKWLGPSPSSPFNIGKFRDGMHRYFKDYADSWLHELGPHIVDLPFWALLPGMPKAVAAAGGRYATRSIADVPDTMDVLWEFPNLIISWHMMQHSSFHFGVGVPGRGRKLGIVFHGTEGTLVADYSMRQVIDADGNIVEGDDYPHLTPKSAGHEREFLNSIVSREECSCSFANHLPLHVALNLAHVALDVDRKIHWNSDTFQVIGDAKANNRALPNYRSPYTLPELPEVTK